MAREEEFSPFKNLDGEDSPEICMKMMSAYYKSWLRKAGFRVKDDDEVKVEISPLFALDSEDFAARLREGIVFSEKLYIE